MPPMRLFLLCAALPLALCACAGAPPSALRTVTLEPGQHADIGHGATLTYDSYSDSRCPKTVWCVWAGELVYRFTLASPTSSESFALTLPNKTYVAHAPGGDTRIAIDPASVPPPPPAAPGSAAERHVLTLTVSAP